MSLFDLVGSFLEPLLDLFPRLARRPQSNEFLVVDSVITGPRTSGLPVLHCPAFTPVQYFPRCEVPIDCGLQRMTTADDSPVAVNATCRVKVIDPILCRDRVGEDWEEAAAMIVRSVVCDLVSGHNLSHLYSLFADNSGWDEANDELQYLGCELSFLCVEDFQQIIPISVLS